jgi:hypothetical protein
MNSDPKIPHSQECFQQFKRECPANKSLHNEPSNQHWWSGWPGAYCMKCGDEDANELCMAGCKCDCHNEFWKECDEYQKTHSTSS